MDVQTKMLINYIIMNERNENVNGAHDERIANIYIYIVKQMEVKTFARKFVKFSKHLIHSGYFR